MENYFARAFVQVLLRHHYPTEPTERHLFAFVHAQPHPLITKFGNIHFLAAGYNPCNLYVCRNLAHKHYCYTQKIYKGKDFEPHRNFRYGNHFANPGQLFTFGHERLRLFYRRDSDRSSGQK